VSLNLNELASKLADDLEVDFGEGGKVKAADLKAWATQSQSEIERRDQALSERERQFGDLQNEYGNFRKGVTQLFQQAAAEASNGGNQQVNPAALAALRQTGGADDDEFAEYSNDPLFGPFAKKYEKRLLKDFEDRLINPLFEQRLKPYIDQLQQGQQQVANVLLDERQRREYRDLGEWPEKFDLESARRYARERNYYVPGTVYRGADGSIQGMVDLHRVNQEVMTPLRHKALEERLTQEAEEKALTRLRQNFNVIPIPNREMGGKQQVKAKGSSPDQIFGNAMNEAAQDMNTLRQLQGIRG
jgi:hypothetical protein